MPKLAPVLAIALLVPLLTAGKRRSSSQPVVSFHLEASETDSKKRTTQVSIDSKTYGVRLSPEFTQLDIAGYYPWLAEDATTSGTAFKLTQRGAARLKSITTLARGQKLFTVVGKDVIGFVVIDGPIEDGYIICWRGLTQKHLDSFKAAGFKRIEPAAEPTPDGDL